jgi:hypothetical protein
MVRKPLATPLLVANFFDRQMMSRDPIINSLTIYGTYMNPKNGVLHTRLPIRVSYYNSFVVARALIAAAGPRI